MIRSWNTKYQAGNGLGQNKNPRTAKSDIRKAELLPAAETRKAIFLPPPDSKEGSVEKVVVV